MQNTENFCMLCFVCSQTVAGQGNTSPGLGSGALQKVSVTNEFSFP